ncbi:MAG: VWA domain-containing protein [Clostridia bacterium]|nr:VWA domain-containing protein [Clostridia bacterium]
MGNKKNENKNGMMEVVFILDRSGSMSGMEADTIGGFNAMLQKQKDESDKIVWSTVLFDHDHEVIHNRVPIQKVEPLNDKQYYVRGTTALLDAVGRAIHHIAMCHKYAKPEDVPEKTLFIITTDGMENASRQYSYRKVKQMIELEQERYGWEFLFLGANIDAPQFAGRIGICAERSATYINDEEGIEKNYAAFSHTVAKMARMEAFEASDLDEIRADFKKRGGRH